MIYDSFKVQYSKNLFAGAPGQRVQRTHFRRREKPIGYFDAGLAHARIFNIHADLVTLCHRKNDQTVRMAHIERDLPGGGRGVGDQRTTVVVDRKCPFGGVISA